MSSYQFVNSLASCYGQAQAQGSQPQRQGPSPGAAAAVAAEYYNPNGAGAYPPAGCYSPQTQAQAHYGQHAYLQSPGMIDYTQLHPSPSTHTQQQQPQQRHLQHTSPGAVSPGPLSATAPTASASAGQLLGTSCKYAESAGVSSPQDLSTTTTTATSAGSAGAGGGRGTPPNVVPGKGVTSPGTRGGSPPVTAGASGASGSSVATTGAASANAAAVAQSSSSPASSTTSNSSTGNGGTNNAKGGSSGNPPQIYPWMKRVHLGQSEYLLFYLLTAKGHKSPLIIKLGQFKWMGFHSQEARTN